MNELQKVMFDIYKVFSSLCSKLNLQFFAFGGTLLGAARHQGFIPWDDDMDFAMMREDYDAFCERAPEILPPGYVIQTFDSCPGYPFPFMKIRNSRTLAEEPGLHNAHFNQGVWIDVFPLDEVDANLYMSPLYLRKHQLLLERVFLRYDAAPITWRDRIYRLKFFLRFPSWKRSARKLAHFYSNKKINSGVLVHNWGALNSKRCLKKEWFRFSGQLPFENESVPVPAEYVALLESYYGDWRSLPPLEERKGQHGCLLQLPVE